MDRDISTRDLNLFIAYCQSFSKSSLIHEIQHGRLNLDQSLLSNTQIDDFSLDCIADLFARDDSGDLFLIRRVFESKVEEIKADEDSLIPILRKLVSSRVHQSLIALFSRVDKDGWKIWRNLSLVTKRNELIKEFSYLSNCYFYYDEFDRNDLVPDSLNPSGEAIPEEQLNDWIRSSLGINYGLPQTVVGVFERLATYPEYQQFISRSRLYNQLKSHLNIAYKDIEEIEAFASEMSDYESSDQHAVNTELCGELELFLKNELFVKYENKGKIDTQLSQNYFLILKLYFSDLTSDGYVDKLQQYLVLANLSELGEQDWLVHRGRLEYLIKLGKIWLRNTIHSQKFSTSNEVHV